MINGLNYTRLQSNSIEEELEILFIRIFGCSYLKFNKLVLCVVNQGFQIA